MAEEIHLLSKKIKVKAIEIGFSLCGICKASSFDEDSKYLSNYLFNKFNGEMDFLNKFQDKRHNPVMLLKDAKSIISLALNYYPSGIQNKQNPVFSKYVYGKDYHFIIKKMLSELAQYTLELIPNIKYKTCVDSVPIFEKSTAQQAGLGWIGKNSLLINEHFGSYVFLSEIIIDKELVYDNSTLNNCGNCIKCIQACPNGAIQYNRTIDSRKCISYLTVEKKTVLNEKENKQIHKSIVGCDICQDVCPYNKNLSSTKNLDFKIKDEILNNSLEDWKNISKEKYNSIFCDSSVKRIKYEKFIALLKVIKNN